MLPSDTTLPEEQLTHMLPALWRSLARATRVAQDTPGLDSQMAVLRSLIATGPQSPTRLSAELRLARPTVSNLLREMLAESLVERTPSEHDGRSVDFSVTDHGRAMLEQFRQDRLEVIGEALATLSSEEQAALSAALPAMRSLFHRFLEMGRARNTGLDDGPAGSISESSAAPDDVGT